MTHANTPLPQRPATKTMDARRRRHASNFSDAVVAVYVHEISARHRPRRRAAEAAATRC
jgi:hypothetical protein